jgi:Fe-S oxidoreductase
MPLPTGEVIGLMSDNLRRRGSVFPISKRASTRWARGLDLPRGGSTVLYTGLMVQLVPYIEVAVSMMERLGDTRLAGMTGLGRRVNRVLDLTRIGLHPRAETRARYDRVLVDVVGLLRAAGVEFGYLYGEELYSGALAHDLGLDEAVTAHARRVTELFRRRGVREIITVDPHTTMMLRTVYPTLVDGFDLTVRSYLEVLAGDGGAGTPGRSLAIELAVHDSCVFARTEGVLDQPRTLLERSGVTIREPAATGRSTWCCGGPAEALFPAKALANAGRRVDQLRAAAPSGVTMCPLCLANLRRAAGDRMDFQDISHYLRQAYLEPAGALPTPAATPKAAVR